MLDEAHLFLWQQLGDVMLRDADCLDVDADVMCENCDRPAHRWALRTAYPYECVYAKATRFHCPSCRILSIQAKEALGIERLAGGTPVYMKLSAFKAAWLVLREGHRPELWAGGKYAEKIPDDCFEVRNWSGNAAIAALLELAVPREGRTLVIELGLRRERIARQLALSSASRLRLCRAEGVTTVSGLSGWPRFKEALQALKPAERRSVITTLRALAEGRLTPGDDKIQALWRAHDEVAAACMDWPVDPHGRLIWLSAGSGL